jgi:integrase
MLSTGKAKSAMITQLVRLARRERLSYDAFSCVCQQARKHLGLKKPQRERKLPYLLTADELPRFFRAVRAGGHVQHEILRRGVCRWVAVMKPYEIPASRVEERAHMPPCPRRLMSCPRI